MNCVTCRVPLDSVELKTHLRSNWHIYNLKRSLKSLPPLSEEQFLKKEKHLQSAEDDTVKRTHTKTSLRCKTCRKNFKSEKTYENHIASEQHKQKEALEYSTVRAFCENASDGNASSVDELDSEEFDSTEFSRPLPVGACFFCDKTYENNPDAIECVLSHMKNRHNFTLPYFEKLVDARGLLSDLGRLVGEEFACIGCGRQFLGRRNDRHKKSPKDLRIEALAAVRQHMMDKSHNFLYTGIEDPIVIGLAVAEAGNDGVTLPSIARVGGELYGQYYNGDQANKTLVLPGCDDKYKEEEAYEVILPSGGAMGHRSYFKTIFRQNANARLELAGTTGAAALPWHAQSGRKALMNLSKSEITELAKKESRDRRAEVMKRSRGELIMGIRGNTVLSKHFRRAE